MRPIILAVLLILPWTVHGNEFTRTRILMGNVPVTLTVDAPASRRLQSFLAMEKAFREAIRIEQKISNFKPQSDTSRLNQNSGKWTKIGPDLLHILTLARPVSELTGGAFDITFKSKTPNYRDVFVDPKNSRAKLKNGTVIGISSIGKGYIVDQISRVLKQKGLKRYLVNAGGDIVAGGNWKVGIRNPHGGPSLFSIDLYNQAISTSGTYERGPHIINPLTQKPVRRKGSATVIATRSALASPLATAAFVMGEKKSRLTFKKIKQVKLIFVD